MFDEIVLSTSLMNQVISLDETAGKNVCSVQHSAILMGVCNGAEAFPGLETEYDTSVPLNVTKLFLASHQASWCASQAVCWSS